MFNSPKTTFELFLTLQSHIHSLLVGEKETYHFTQVARLELERSSSAP